MNVSFTKNKSNILRVRLSRGDFQSASEVVRDALRLHQIYRARVIEELREEIMKGWDGSTSKRKVSDIVQAKKQSSS